MNKIIKIVAVPQPKNTGYHWIYGLGDDNRMYIWHEMRGEWVLHKKRNPNY